jgi:hypothetical protein
MESLFKEYAAIKEIIQHLLKFKFEDNSFEIFDINHAIKIAKILKDKIINSTFYKTNQILFYKFQEFSSLIHYYNDGNTEKKKLEYIIKCSFACVVNLLYDESVNIYFTHRNFKTTEKVSLMN